MPGGVQRANGKASGKANAVQDGSADHHAGHGGCAGKFGAMYLSQIPTTPGIHLLGIALGTTLALGGFKIGGLVVAGDSLWIPILIIGLVYVPYMARPVRGEILALREKEFVEAAVAQGKGPVRIMVSELLPNIVSTIIVFFTLNIANNMLLESALSFLGAGVRPPNASWGTMIADGYQTIYTAPHLTIVPGLMIVLTVLSLNVFGDGLRDALDPRAKIRLEH